MTAAHPEPPMSVRLPRRTLTLDDVTLLAAEDDVHRYELDEGNLVIMPPADAEHAALIMRLGGWLMSGGYDADRVLPTPGLEINEETTGRSPDLVLLRRSIPGSTVWIDPADVALVVEIVSAGSKKLDRLVKPGEYARSGIAHYWRVEREQGQSPTVHTYTLGVGEHGEPAYASHRAVLLDELLSAPPPALL